MTEPRLAHNNLIFFLWSGPQWPNTIHLQHILGVASLPCLWIDIRAAALILCPYQPPDFLRNIWIFSLNLTVFSRTPALESRFSAGKRENLRFSAGTRGRAAVQRREEGKPAVRCRDEGKAAVQRRDRGEQLACLGSSVGVIGGGRRSVWTPALESRLSAGTGGRAAAQRRDRGKGSWRRLSGGFGQSTTSRKRFQTFDASTGSKAEGAGRTGEVMGWGLKIWDDWRSRYPST